MVRRINRLLILIAVVATALYLSIKNRGAAHVYINEGHQYDVTVGLVLIVAFIAGILLTTAIASYYAFCGYLRERALRNKEKLQRTIREKMVEARGLFAAGNFDSARVLWEQVLKRDPSNPVARLEVARSLEQSGDLEGAFAYLDIARRSHPNNVELLLYAAELHAKNKNLTSAVDHLGLVLKQVRSKKVALKAAELADELGRYEQALELYKQYEQFGGYAPELQSKIEYHKLVALNAEKPDTLYRDLHDFTKRFPHCVEALIHLGKVEASNNRDDAAAQLFIKAAKNSGQLQDWNRAVELWLSSEKPERALAVAKSARNDSKGEGRLRAELITLRLQLQLALLVESMRTIEGFPALASDQTIAPSRDIWAEFYGLKAWYFTLVGNSAEAAESLKALNNLYLGITPIVSGYVAPQTDDSQEGHAPHLSTP